MSWKDILNGHMKELFNKEEDLFSYRMKICSQCPLYTETKVGPMCDGSKKITKNNIEINGCGCRLNAKARLLDAKCKLNKW